VVHVPAEICWLVIVPGLSVQLAAVQVPLTLHCTQVFCLGEHVGRRVA
jgi:hypothetical protein